MAEIFINDYINKIIYLESKLGERVNYQILEPEPLPSTNILTLQAVAKSIAGFIGLNNYTFIVAIAKLKKGVGGHIELKQSDREVFIEVSEDAMKYDHSILATLAHEITHKYLYINGISSGHDLFKEYENEILTDLSSVYLGLGKLLLNGCECKKESREFLYNETRTTTESYKCGYLNRDQLAFIYRFVCAMRKISPTIYERNLTSESIETIRKIESNYSYFFNQNFHEVDFEKKAEDLLHSAVSDTQFILSNIEKNILYIQKSMIKVVKNFLRQKHKRMNTIKLTTNRMVNKSDYNPCMKFLHAQRFDLSISKFISEIKDISSEADDYQNKVIEIVNCIQSSDDFFPQSSSDMFNIISCRNCGSKLRLPENKTRLIAICPKCQYKFVTSTSKLISKEVYISKKKSSLKTILKKLFSKS